MAWMVVLCVASLTKLPLLIAFAFQHFQTTLTPMGLPLRYDV